MDELSPGRTAALAGVLFVAWVLVTSFLLWREPARAETAAAATTPA